MKIKKVMFGLSVLSVLMAFVVGGAGNLYAQNNVEQQKLKQLDTMVADLSLSKTQKEKYVQFKSSLEKEPVVEKNMEFVNKLITVMSF